MWICLSDKQLTQYICISHIYLQGSTIQAMYFVGHDTYIFKFNCQKEKFYQLKSTKKMLILSQNLNTGSFSGGKSIVKSGQVNFNLTCPTRQVSKNANAELFFFRTFKIFLAAPLFLIGIWRVIRYTLCLREFVA